MFFSLRNAALGTSAAAIALAATGLATQAWRVDASPGDADSTFVPITNCRLADTIRLPGRHRGRALTAAETRVLRPTARTVSVPSRPKPSHSR
ncbi:MAG: hypothetical protein R2697_05875 [Ilumatobacteraceae bacterium]